MDKIMGEDNLYKSQVKVQDLYDAIVAVQADDLAMGYFTGMQKRELNRVGVNADHVVGKIMEDLP